MSRWDGVARFTGSTRPITRSLTSQEAPVTAPDPTGSANDDIKARMREALDRKNSREQGVHEDGPAREKAHGSEVVGGAPKMHRRKAGGGGS